MKKVFSILFCLTFSMVMSAQTSGGQITRPSKKTTQSPSHKPQIKSTKDAEVDNSRLPNYSYVHSFENYENGKRKYGFKNGYGEEVIPPTYDDIKYVLDMWAVCKNGKWGFVDVIGKEVTPPKYDEVSFFSGRLIKVRNDKKYGFVNHTGNGVTPIVYDDAFSFDENGMAMVKRNGKWGFINQTGNEVIPPIYDWVLGFEKGFAQVGLNGEEFYINEQGVRQ